MEYCQQVTPRIFEHLLNEWLQILGVETITPGKIERREEKICLKEIKQGNLSSKPYMM